MTPIPHTGETDAVARRVIWFESPAEALDRATPGIIDARSWAYWNSKFGRWPPPPMPRRFGTGNLPG